MKRMKRLLFVFGLIALGGASAQSASDIVQKMEDAQKSKSDLSFKLNGSLQMGNSKQALEANVRLLPKSEVTRVEFRQPSSISGDVFVADRNQTRHYGSMSNQIVVSSSRERSNSALGFDLSAVSNAAELQKRFDVTLLNTSGKAGDRSFKLQGKTKTGQPQTAHIWVSEKTWQPTRVQAFDNKGALLADLTLSDWRSNSGLTDAQLRRLPAGARVVNR